MSQQHRQPELTAAEWRAVSVALAEAGGQGCAAGHPIAHRLLGLIARRPAPAAMPDDPRLDAVRRFLCATQRQGRPAEEFAGALVELGFNERQIEALALLAA